MKTTGTKQWAGGGVLLLIIVGLVGLSIVLYQGTVGSQVAEPLTMTGRYRWDTLPPVLTQPEGRGALAPLLGPAFGGGAVIADTDLAQITLTVHVPPISADTEYLSGTLLAAMPPVLAGPAGELRIEVDPRLTDVGVVYRGAGETILKGTMDGHITYQDGTQVSANLHVVIIPERQQGNFSLVLGALDDRPGLGANFGDLDLTPALMQTIVPGFELPE